MSPLSAGRNRTVREKPPEDELNDGYLLALLDVREGVEGELRVKAARAERRAKAVKRPANQRLNLWK